ncbi:MAG TPA: TonB-dependent receptor [Opitutaceae bacterium]|nr:TonB-dependent receptor [Opitutaceae bacterium]
MILRSSHGFITLALYALLWACVCGCIAPVAAQSEQSIDFNLAEDALENSLRQFADQSGLEVLIPSETFAHVRTKAVRGKMPPGTALRLMLAGTDLTVFEEPRSGALTLKRKPAREAVSKGRLGRGPASYRPQTKSSDASLDGDSNPVNSRSTLTVVVTWIAGLFGSTPANLSGADSPSTSLASSSSEASAIATLSGHVMDANTGKYLEGAEVSIEGTLLSTTTEREGYFIFPRLNSGKVTLIVRYPGLNERREQITLIAGKTASVSLRLSDSEIVLLEQFRVSSTKEGMAQAIASQKAAANSMMVAAADQFGDMAEGGNAAEYLKFLPGVGIDYANNEARAVSLRGLSSAFTNVSFDNNPVASASSGNLSRTFEFEQVAVNNVETVEVFKTVLPDQPATSTGGAINLVSKSAFDREGSRLTYRAFVAGTTGSITTGKTPGWGQGLNHKLLPGFDANYSTRLNENLGFNLTVSDSQRYTNMARSEYIPEFNPANGGLPLNPAPTGWHLLNEQKNTNRRSASGKVDWRPGARTKISLSAQWNWFDMIFSQRDLRVFTGALAPLAVGQSPAYSGNSITGLPSRGSVPLNQVQSWKHGVTYATGLNVEHILESGGKFNLSTYWSQSYSKYRNASEGYYSNVNTNLTGVTVAFSGLDQIAPEFRVTDATGAPVDIDDHSRRSINSVTHNSRTGVDTRDGVSLDYTKDLTLRMPVRIKLGARRDNVGRNIHNLFYSRSLTITGPALATLRDPVWSGRSLGFGTRGNVWPSIYRAYETYGPAPSATASDVLARFDETTSLYVRADIKPLPNLLVIAGVRRESRESDNVDRKAGEKGRFEHSDYFPSLNIKYNVNSNFLIRFGAAQTIGLPNYNDLLPSRFTITEPNEETGADGRIAIANPNLQPYEVNNYDLSAEYYLKNSGFFSASIFRKDFYNYIISASQELTPSAAAAVGLDPSTLTYPLDRYNLTSLFNIKDPGHYNGIELAYAQTLNFLPKPFKGLGLQVNYTALRVEGIETSQVFDPIDTALDASIREQVKRALHTHAVKEQLNVVINYRLGRWSALLSTHYTGDVFRGSTRRTVRYSGTTANQYFNEERFSAARALVDLRIDYRINQRFTPYLQVRNLFARPQIYESVGRLLHYTTYGDPMYELGVRGVW